MQVSTTLKGCVFTPLRKYLKTSTSVAAFATFIASGLFHEYQFLLSFPKYTLGSISFFFAMQSGFAFLETLLGLKKGTGVSSFLGVPYWVQSLCVLLAFSPTIPHFSKIWFDEGMFDVMSAMTPQFKYE